MMEPKKEYGPVQDGKIVHLAVTGVAQFNVDEEGCPSRWFYKNVLKRPEPQQVWHTKGTEVDDQINHYLPTGQNVLGRVARAGIHLLPAPGTDLLVQWGLNNKLRPRVNGKWKNYFPPSESLLWAADVPFVGFPDVINARQEYLVPSDDTIQQKVELRVEPGVVEVLDNKTSSDFKWAKPSNKLLQQTQMNGYGLFVLEVDSSVTGVRLSHNTYRTDDRMAPAAIKRSVLISAKEIRERWTRVVEPIVEQMKSVAGEKDETKVPFNLNACESFGGCPHKENCHARRNLNPIERMKMSLLKNRPAAGTPVAPAANGTTPWISPPVPPAAPNVAALPIMQTPPVPSMAPQPPVAQQYAPPVAPPAPVAPPPPVPVAVAPAAPPATFAAPSAVGPILAIAAVQNENYWVNGHLAKYLCSTNGKQAFISLQGGTTPIHVDYQTQIFPEAAFAAPAPATGAPGVAPAAPPAVSAAQSVAPPPPPAPGAQPAKRGRRKLQIEDVSTPAAPAAPQAVVAPVAAPPQAAVPKPAPATGSFQLFVNAVPNSAFIDLSAYVHEAVEQIRAQFNVADIRVAPDDSPIGYAKWRGVLAGMVRAEPPAPGTYVAFTKGSEFTEVVVEALWPVAAPGSARAF